LILTAGKRAWSNAWLRAGLLHPALFVAPWAILVLALATPADDTHAVNWAILVIPMGAAGSVLTTVAMAFGRPRRTSERVVLVLLGLVAGGVALVLGLMAWLHAAEIACAGRYECPF
jgi:O-antigen/teichoic acid export membrane protein